MFCFIGNIKKLLFLLILFLIFHGALLAVDNGKIKGLVLDGVTGAPLPYANVFLDSTSFGSSTDLYGKFLILEIPPGSYTISVRYIGYKQQDEPIEVPSGDALEKEFEVKFFDPAPYNPNFDSEKDVDGLKIPWSFYTYVNPPYSNVGPWVKKAKEEHRQGKTIILLLKTDSVCKEYFRFCWHLGKNKNR